MIVLLSLFILFIFIANCYNPALQGRSVSSPPYDDRRLFSFALQPLFRPDVITPPLPITEGFVILGYSLPPYALAALSYFGSGIQLSKNLF
jgi:hypothetical protein